MLLGILWSPSFNIGVTSAIFQQEGNVDNLKDALMIEVIDGRIAGRFAEIRVKISLFFVLSKMN